MTKFIPCIAVRNQDTILLLQRGTTSKYPGQWCIPGGKMEGNESDIQCAARELREETGIHLNLSDLFPLTTISSRDGTMVFLVFLAIVNPRPRVTIEPGFDGFGWFSLKNIEDLELHLDLMEPAAKVMRRLEAFG